MVTTMMNDDADDDDDDYNVAMGTNMLLWFSGTASVALRKKLLLDFNVVKSFLCKTFVLRILRLGISCGIYVAEPLPAFCVNKFVCGSATASRGLADLWHASRESADFVDLYTWALLIGYAMSLLRSLRRECCIILMRE